MPSPRRALCFGVLIAGSGLGLGLACGPPSSFDHLVGGDAPTDAGKDAVTDAEVEAGPADGGDSTLPAPRPMTPLSATWVNGTRPHFAWRLAPPLTGARIELSTTPLFDRNVQVYDAETDFDPPADLAPGFWFWRLLGKTTTAVGTEDHASPIWEVLVRGGGASTHANGAMVDIDRDGHPDIVTAIHWGDPKLGPPSVVVGLFSTSPDNTNFENPFGFGKNLVAPGPPSQSLEPMVAVTDVNGDGYSDVTVGDVSGGNVRVATFNGTTVGLDLSNGGAGTSVELPPFATVPLLGEAMDIDGDGYGDMVLASDSATYSVYGSAQGFGAMEQLFSTAALGPDAGFPVDAGPLPFEARYDRNADGLSDVAMSWPIGPGIVLLYQGASNRDSIDRTEYLGVTTPNPPAPTRLVGSDVDGDGKNDLALVTTIAGGPAVCVLLGSALRSAPYPCWSPASTPAGFASAMIAVDVEPDGRDELLVGSSSGGVDVLRLVAPADGGAPSLVAEHLTTDYGATLTTVHPGRPTPGIWVAGRLDGSALQLFQGKAPGQVISAPPPLSFALTLR
jgi:hypothetical protein